MKSPIPPRGPAKSDPQKVRVKWTSTLRFAGPFPEKSKQFFRLETLEGAIQKKLDEKDFYLFRTLRDALDGRMPATLYVDLIYENKSKLVFSLIVGCRQGKRVPLFLSLAKNHEEHSAALMQECEALSALNKEWSKGFVAPLYSGLVYLPDRYRRRDVNRELFSYLYKMPGEWIPLYVASATQFGPRGEEHRRFTLQETESIKCQLIQHLAGAYKHQSFEGITPRQLAPDDLWVRKNKDRSIDLTLTGCRRIEQKLRPGLFIASLLFGSFSNGKEQLPLAPMRPDDFLNALTKGASKDQTELWCSAFLRQRKRHEEKLSAASKSFLPGSEYLDALADLF